MSRGSLPPRRRALTTPSCWTCTTLYEGPHHATNRASNPHYGRAAHERAARALRPGGILAIWSEERDRPFEARLAAAGFEVQRRQRGRGGRAHTIYIGARRPPRR